MAYCAPLCVEHEPLRDVASRVVDARNGGRRDSLPPVLVAQRNNFVERPWGGLAIRPYKGLHPLPDQIALTGVGLGEAFEISAWDDDSEARDHPTRVQLGSKRHLLGRLLAERGLPVPEAVVDDGTVPPPIQERSSAETPAPPER